MSDALQQAIVAIKTGDATRAGQLLTQILKADSKNADAWVWLAHIAGSEERRRACLEQALALNPDHPEVRQALLDWVLAAPPVLAAPTPAGSPLGVTPPAQRVAPPPPLLPPPPGGLSPVAGTSLQDFLLQLTKNYNILKEREAKYGSTAAPLDLLNQIDDYEHAIALTQEAINRAAPLEELQSEFGSLNLQISTIVFVATEPPRKPFKGLNPYRGLLKFTEDDAQFFFGRNAAIQSLLNTVQYLVESETGPQTPDLITVLGPSGSGKSSLVRAGLIPALSEGRVPGSQQWPIKVMLPGPQPLDALAEVFVGKVGQDLAAIRAGLNGGEKALHQLIVESLTLNHQPEETPFILVIDQFEETFILCEDEAERRAFIDQLLYTTQVRRNRSFVVLTMRSDFYSKVAAYKRLAEVITLNQMLVSPMTEKELREAILLPAEAVGLELEKALVESLLRDTANAPGVLPLMQHALLELFHRRDGNLLTLEAYNDIGGVKGALAHRADSVINELNAEQQKIARRIFMRLVRPGEGTADTRRRASFDEVLTQNSQPQQVEVVVKTLADANLIITDQNQETGEVVLDVSHEALIQEWPLLRHWLSENRESLRIQQQVSQASRDWQARGRDEDSLYRGARLLEVEEWAAANPGELNPLEQAFLTASIEFREREATAKEAQRQRELEQAQALAEEQGQRAEEQAKAATRLRTRALIATGIGAIAILAALAAVWFGVQSNENARIAQTNANLATARQLAALARANLTDRLDQSLLLSLESYFLFSQNNIADTVRARDSLLAALTHQPRLITFLAEHDDAVYSVAFSPDGKTLASGSRDNTVILWDVATGRPRGDPLTGHRNRVYSVAFSPDGKTLASGSWDSTIILWDVATGQPRGVPLEGHEGAVWSVAFSPPDGKTLASAADDESTIILWDVATGRPRGDPLEGHKASVRSVAFSPPDGKTLASSSADGAIILWDVATGRPRGDPLEGHEASVRSVAFSPDGKTLASGSRDSTIILWDVATVPPRGDPLTGHKAPVWAVAFSPDGKTLASGGIDKTIILWDLASHQQLGPPLVGHNKIVSSVAFSPDGKTLASGSTDTTVILWDTSTLPPPSGVEPARIKPQVGTTGPGRLLTGHKAPVWAVAFSPDGKTLASSSADGAIFLWDVATGRRRGDLLEGHEDSVRSVAFSPDGKTLASAADDESTIILWDVATGRPRGDPLEGHKDSVRSVAFSPDGKTLASSSADGAIILWDVATSQPRGDPLEGHEDSVRSVAFSPDGKTLASGSSDRTVILWDVATGRPRGAPLTSHEDQVRSVAFSSDGKTLASSSWDSTIMLWDPVSGQQLGQPLARHKGEVNSVAFSLAAAGSSPQPSGGPSGETLASGSDDHTIILWDLGSGQQLGDPLTGHEARVGSVAFSPDGKTLASGSDDHTIILWDVNFASWQAYACRRANRNLTQEEWNDFIGPDIPYHRTCPDLPPGQGVEE